MRFQLLERDKKINRYQRVRKNYNTSIGNKRIIKHVQKALSRYNNIVDDFNDLSSTGS